MASFAHFLIPLFPLVMFFIFLYKWQSSNNNHAQKRVPPSPRKLPVIGNLHQIGLSLHKSLHSLSTKHGPLMLLRFGRVPVLVVSSADAAREILKNQDSIFSNRPKLTIPYKLFYGSKDSVFSPYGDYSNNMRDVYIHHLMSVHRSSFRDARDEETSLMILNMTRQSSSVVINLSDMLASLAHNVFCRVAFGRKYSIKCDEGRELRMKLNEEMEMLGSTYCVGDHIPWLAWIDRVSGLNAKVEKLAKWFDRFLETVLEEHRAKNIIGESVDFVDILIELQRSNDKDGSFAVGDDDIKGVIHNTFVGGIEATFSVMEWTMAELLKNPNKMEKLQHEVRRVAGYNDEITEDDLEKLHYLKAVIKESIRLHSPAPLLVRESTQDTKVTGYDVPAGTMVVVNTWSIGRDPMLWENPEDFNPERFLDNNMDFKGVHFEFIPFGAGRRGCPGMDYVTVLSELAIARLVHKFNFDLPDQARKNDLDVSETAGAIAHLQFPLLVGVTESLYFLEESWDSRQ
ncbi:hypothetical protein ABFS82_11G110600 [Erythranthe guttata]|uniref:Cytochrome P450 n=1 Tax=Erythranthe guttata TaxID=4155 RepID=A0A022QAE0_ERYGU|nr:hypothetical protein MIMGU_mgv1a026069mg [Erythranthe guttata]